MTILEEVRVLIRLMSPALRLRMVMTLLLMLLGIFAEMLTIGAVLPFIAFATNPESEMIGPQARAWFNWIHDDPLIAASIVLGGAAICSTGVRLFLSWASQKFIVNFGAELSREIFGRIIRQPYAEQVRRNSSEIMSGISKVNDVVYGFVQPLMQALISLTMVICISVLLFAISPFAAGVAGSIIVTAYALVARLSIHRLQHNSEIIATQMTRRTRILQDSLGGIRDIILERSQDVFESKFADADQRNRAAVGMNNVIATTPRYIVEAAGILAIIFVTAKMSAGTEGFTGAIPTLGAISFGALRLLPLVQSTWNGLSAAMGNRELLADVLTYSELPVPDQHPKTGRITLDRQLAFKNVSFRYTDGSPTLSKVSIEINQGEHIGISGITGSGKSTFLDLVSGLLVPDEGQISVDGVPLRDENIGAWQASIAHVPQSIFLVDDTISANIIFGSGRETIDESKLRRAATVAQLDPFLESLPLAFDTCVGERGVRLSGGQRQRIGIARAIYRQASVLILDEATSALDGVTEANIMTEISKLSDEFTVITVAHRQSTLAYCDRILNVADGQLHWR
ncbi:ABC transporter ATP-binding protein [Sphingorhabdus sp. 109]|uniref:ABC transporter ATP-binding protein n=1 Tax=Sphingorhabdus sp. 109 TaxID=2653173 RepID=UPI0012F07AA0|nr:ABC transporter ATP-binding protein [Sphingorhabdus sp. 109]VWX57553.1 ABC transporter transmembrane region [Sphingorhabdus sp. 109]